MTKTGQETPVPGQLIQEQWTHVFCGHLEKKEVNCVNSIKNKQHVRTNNAKKGNIFKEQSIFRIQKKTYFVRF